MKADKTGVETANLKMSMILSDDCCREAIRRKEAGTVTEIVLLFFDGLQQCQETIRTALAMGADRGIHVLTDQVEPLAVAKLLKAIIALKEAPLLVILGKQAIEDH